MEGNIKHGGGTTIETQRRYPPPKVGGGRVAIFFKQTSDRDKIGGKDKKMGAFGSRSIGSFKKFQAEKNLGKWAFYMY